MSVLYFVPAPVRGREKVFRPGSSLLYVASKDEFESLYPEGAHMLNEVK